MKAKEIMSNNPQFINPDSMVEEAARMMRDNDCGYLPVGEGDRLVGTVTDRDIVIRAVAEGRDITATPVRQVMSEGIRFCFEDDDVQKAAEMMKEHQIRRLVVLNKDKRLRGIVSLGDIATRCKSDKLTGETEQEVCQKAA